MSSVFPSLSAFGGVKGIGKFSDVTHKNPSLEELKKGSARMVDTFIYDYSKLVVRDDKKFADVTGTAANVKVAIIGSGFAGATAAYELKRAGILSKNITVYEARRPNPKEAEAQVGGRAYSREFKDKNNKIYVNEMGPMRVPSNSKLFWHYLSKVVTGNPTQRVFPNPGVVATQLIFRGLKYSWKGKGGTPMPERDSDKNVDWKKLQDNIGAFIGSLNFGGEDVGTIAQLLQKEKLTEDDKKRIFKYWKHFLLKYNDVPFIKALEDYFEDVWGETEYSMFSTLGLGTGGFGPLFPVCLLEILRLLVWEYDDEYIPYNTDGQMPMTEIVKGLFQESKAQILNETVDYIEMLDYVEMTDNGEMVRVYSIKNDNTINEKTYNYVIVATTLRSMQIRMNLDAKAPPRQNYATKPGTAVFGGDEDYKIRESIRIPHIMNSSKLFGLVSPKPWKNDEITAWPTHPPEGGDNAEPIKCVLTDTLARQMYFLDPYEDVDQASSNVLISYNWGDDSVKIMAIRNYQDWQVVDPEKGKDFNLKNAYQFGLEGSDIGNNPIAAALASITDKDNLQSIVWQEEPMIFGAFKIDYPNQFYATSQLVYQYQQAVKEKDEYGTVEAGKRVYLAGNNCSFQGGWVEGAMQSGVNASAAVLKHMQLTYGTEEVENFRMDDLFKPNPFQEVLKELEKSTSPLKGDML